MKPQTTSGKKLNSIYGEKQTIVNLTARFIDKENVQKQKGESPSTNAFVTTRKIKQHIVVKKLDTMRESAVISE